MLLVGGTFLQVGKLTEITAKREVSADELQRVKSGEEKGYPADFEERDQVAYQLVGLVRDGRTPSWLTRWPELLREAQLARVQQAANRIAQPERYQIIIAGDRGAHLEHIKTLGLPIIIYSPQGEVLERIPAQQTKAETKAP